jgi:nicotinate-nucleotide pyrophosphorylase (carboxylating)
MLTTERILLNFIGRLSGIATLTRRYVDRVRGTKASVYDTRKTTPGWRRMEKLAVRLGGGSNHRLGLFSAIMIKDNHLAHMEQPGFSLADAVRQARDFASNCRESDEESGIIVELEVDTLSQFRRALVARPDIILLDNMTVSELSQCVHLRNSEAAEIQLEASGGVTLDTITAIADTGVDRISVGALTHSATSIDVGLDWKS